MAETIPTTVDLVFDDCSSLVATPSAADGKSAVKVGSESASSATQTAAETPSTTIGSPDSSSPDHAARRVEFSFSSSTMNATSPSKDQSLPVSRSFADGTKKQLLLTTPPRTQSTSRMFQLTQVMSRNFPSPQEDVSSIDEDSPKHKGKSSDSDEDSYGFSTPPKSHQGAPKHYIQGLRPSLLFGSSAPAVIPEEKAEDLALSVESPKAEPKADRENEEPGQLTRKVETDLETRTKVVEEDEPGHLTPKKSCPESTPKNYVLTPENRLVDDEESWCDSSVCPFDCVNEYQEDLAPPPPPPEEGSPLKKQKGSPGFFGRIRLGRQFHKHEDVEAGIKHEVYNVDTEGNELQALSKELYCSNGLGSNSPTDSSDSTPKEAKNESRNWLSITYKVLITLILITIVLIVTLLFLGRKKQAVDATNNHQGESEAIDSSTDVPEKENEDPPSGGFFSTDNHFCSSASLLDELDHSFYGSTTAAVWDSNINTCGDSMAIGYGAWYSFKTEESQLVEASTCDGASFDTQITVMKGKCSTLSCVTFNDQACGDQSRASWFAEAGETYYILVHGFREANGEFAITLKQAKSNDVCTGSEGPIRVGSSVFGTTSGANKDELEQCGDVSLATPGVWYMLDPNLEGNIRTEVIANTVQDVPQVAVYSGVGCDQLTCEVGSSSGSVTWEANNSTNYYVFVNSLMTTKVDFDLYVSWDWKDTCSDAIELIAGETLFVSTTSEASPQKVSSCGGQTGLHSAPGMWLKVNGTGNMLQTSTCYNETELDAHVSVFRGSCGALECIGGSGQVASCESGSSISWPSVLGEEYHVFVSGRGSRVGDFALSIDEIDLAIDLVANPGNSCASSISLGASDAEIAGSTENSVEVEDPCRGVGNATGVWYEVEGTGSTITLSTCNNDTNFETRVSLFSGSCDGLKCIAQTFSCETNGSLQWTAVAGQKYHVFVHGATANEVGDFLLNMNENTQHDSCASARVIEAETGSYFGTTEEAELVVAESCEKGPSFPDDLGPAVWYTIRGTGNFIFVSTCSQDTEIGTEISVFSGACGTLECVSTDGYDCGNQGVVSWLTQKDQLYFFRVAGSKKDGVGNFAVSVSSKNSFFGW